MPIQYQCGSSMAIRQICQYKYTNIIYTIQMFVRWSSTSWHESDCRKTVAFLRTKGLELIVATNDHYKK